MSFGITPDFASVPHTASLSAAIERDIGTSTGAARAANGEPAELTRSPAAWVD